MFVLFQHSLYMSVFISFDNQDEGNGIMHKTTIREGSRTDMFEEFEMWVIVLSRHCQDAKCYVLCQSPELL